MCVCLRKSVLYVDYEPMNAKGLRRVLNEEYNIFSAGDASEGYKMLDSAKLIIQTVIVEDKLPGQQGLDFLASVQNDHPHIVRVLTSTYLEQHIQKALANGTIHYHLPKPWDIRELESMLMMEVE